MIFFRLLYGLMEKVELKETGGCFSVKLDIVLDRIRHVKVYLYIKRDDFFLL